MSAPTDADLRHALETHIAALARARELLEQIDDLLARSVALAAEADEIRGAMHAWLQTAETAGRAAARMIAERRAARERAA